MRVVGIRTDVAGPTIASQILCGPIVRLHAWLETQCGFQAALPCKSAVPSYDRRSLTPGLLLTGSGPLQVSETGVPNRIRL